MKIFLKYLIIIIVLLLSFFLFKRDTSAIYNHIKSGDLILLNNGFSFPLPPDTIRYPIQQNENTIEQSKESKLYLKTPPNVKTEIEYDPITNQYIFSKKVGDITIDNPTPMNFNDYLHYDLDNSLKKYWNERSNAESSDKQRALIPKIRLGGQVLNTLLGGNTIDIRPSGSAELIFAVNSMKRDDPAIDVKRRRTTNFDFQEKIQMNVVAKIGDKIEFNVNYNTEATFEFENKMKLKYEGKEDEIIKLIEAGDVTLPLTSTLITGSQALFGIKTQLQFGRATVTGIFSQQKSKTSTIEVAGGAQKNTFSIKADQYEENKHFLLGHYFRKNYNKSLEKLPIVQSNINITKIEVWITNIGPATTENRNIVAFQDLGEFDNIYNKSIMLNNNSAFNQDKTLPKSRKNKLYEDLVNNKGIRNINDITNFLAGGVNGISFVSGIDYEKVENARKLSQSEYSFNSKLGFISLNTTLNSDQILAVAYQYKVIGDDSTYQVGEFSTDGITAPQCLIVKLLKGTSINTRIPMWKLMMKNVYPLGGYQINPQDFRLNILYSADENGVPTGYITEGAISGIPLIRALKLDNLNTQLDPYPDGIFDFIDGASINGGNIQASNGRVYFPVLQPFGEDLKQLIIGNNPSFQSIANKYSYDSLYTMTKNGAQQYPDKNKFLIDGIYKSSVGSEISLNAMNVPQGSVKVTSGGIPLIENVDYTVDYTLGRVKVINDGILNSGTPIQISLESNSLFNIQTKTLMGAHVDYKINNNFNVGATILNLTERPITQKVNYGDEPISNTIWGLNSTYQTESNLITKLVDKIPFIETKSPSKVILNGEFAHLIPGHSSSIGESGTSYIDDFEGSKSSIDLKNIGTWFLASTPQLQTESNLFPEGGMNTKLDYGKNRALFAWYVIDPLFWRNNNLTPPHIVKDPNQQSNHYVREVLETEVFPNKQSPNGQPTNIPVLNLAFYPNKKGPYNFDSKPSKYSKGVDASGFLNAPETRWGGIMRKIETTDFEATNVEYIQFWIMDPFVYNKNAVGGDLYFNFGDISEDILKDGRKSYENGLPTSATDTVSKFDNTIWGRVPKQQALTNSFDYNNEARKFQDVGIDGLSDTDEKAFYNNYINEIQTLYPSSNALTLAQTDPSNDNYHYFRGSDYDNNNTSILDRYKHFNGLEGNSVTSEDSPESYPTSSTTIPNVEDINMDNTLSETERYFQYKVSLSPTKMVVGENYITDKYDATVTLKNGNSETVTWYQFKIPVRNPDKVVGSIQDFKSIRFMRMFLKGFREPVFVRFATLELVRSDWRKYNYSLLSPGEYNPNDNSNTIFNVSTVNIEENGKRTPVPYVLPPGIEREINLATTNLQRMNEQSLSLKVCNLNDGDVRAVYKTCDFDSRQYKKLKMYVHAEAGEQATVLNKGDLSVFIRLGKDFNNNYYEYEIPLTPTPWGTSASNIDAIWQAVNAFEFEFKVLQDAKQKRNVLMRELNSKITLTTPFYDKDGENTICVVGTPNISDIKTIMIGVRNNKRGSINSKSDDDGLAKCAEIWVDEMRFTDFNETGGWAANARINTNLADFGNLVLAGNISTPGFGSIDKKVNERQKEEITQFDIATNLELGKFFPEKAGLKIPMHFDYSEIVSNPQYNPINPDIDFKEDLKSYKDANMRDSVKRLSQDYTQRKSINFVNVKKNRVGGSMKTRIWDPENFDFTYAFTEVYKRNIDIAYNLQQTYKGAIGYNFTNNPKNYYPFQKSPFLSKYNSLRIIKDFNFFLMPRMISIRTDLDRGYQKNVFRNKTAAIIIMEPNYVKSFNWNRIYDVKFDLTQSLKLDFTANASARIDEPQNRIDKDTIMRNLMDGGRMTLYNQALTANYNLPINKIGLFNWLSSSVRYTGEYHWTASPLYRSESTGQLVQNPIGNTIENSNTKQINAGANMMALYNKVPYFRKLNQPAKQPPIQNNDDENAENKEDTATKPKINYVKLVADNILKVMLSVKNVSASYSESNGMMLPGFLPKPKYFGQDWDKMAPGVDFILGSQKDIRQEAAFNNWLTKDRMMNNAFARKHNENFNARVTVEPLPSMRIELTANYNYSKSNSDYYRIDSITGKLNTYSQTEMGNFSMSYLTLNTAFIADDDKDYSSQNFRNFQDYRKTIAQRLANNNRNSVGLDSAGFPSGFGSTSQEVLIPAFLAAYSGSDPNKISLDPLYKIPKPNWRITYDGLSKIPFLKLYFKSITLTHSYRSTYNVGNYNNNVKYGEDFDGIQNVRDAINNFIPQREIGSVSINEQFNPLLNFDMTWNNNMMTRIEFRKSRDLALTLSNNQLTEIKSSEMVFGIGYRIKDVQFNIISLAGGKKKNVKSDVNIKCDVAIKNNKTILRKLIEDFNQISAGQRVITINLSADYLISERLTLRAFFDKIVNNPFVSSQFPNSNTNGGISLRFSLAQ